MRGRKSGLARRREKERLAEIERIVKGEGLERGRFIGDEEIAYVEPWKLHSIPSSWGDPQDRKNEKVSWLYKKPHYPVLWEYEAKARAPVVHCIVCGRVTVKRPGGKCLAYLCNEIDKDL